MIGGLWNGFSGINTYDKALKVESNNSTNTNTVGYKANDVRFEDMLYENGIGKGVNVEEVFKRFQQGDIKPTGHTLDLGIEGSGYFIVKDIVNNQNFYTRAGDFQLGSDGFLQSKGGLRVQGLTPQLNEVITTNENLNQLTKEHSIFLASETIRNDDFAKTINARISDYTKTAQSSGVSGEGYKSATAKMVDIEALISNYQNKLNLYRSISTDETVLSKHQITDLDYTSYLYELKDQNDFLKVTIGQEEVKQHFKTDLDTTMRLFADKISDIAGMKATVDSSIGKVKVESMIPGKEVLIYDASVNNKSALQYEVQSQSLGKGYGVVISAREALKSAVEAAGAEFIEITNTINLKDKDLSNLNSIQMKLANLNLSEYTFGTINIEDGIVYLSDGDNKFVVGKIETGFFRNDQGLDPQGDNLFKKTNEAGEIQDAEKLNKLHSESLEVSNTDNADSMTNLLTYQKAFEANAKSITTSDELLKIAINLRK